jgi:hypothetical protein
MSDDDVTAVAVTGVDGTGSTAGASGICSCSGAASSSSLLSAKKSSISHASWRRGETLATRRRGLRDARNRGLQTVELAGGPLELFNQVSPSLQTPQYRALSDERILPAGSTMKRVRVVPDDPRRQKIVALVGEAAFAKTVRKDRDPWGERQTWRAIAERHLLLFVWSLVLVLCLTLQHLLRDETSPRHNTRAGPLPADLYFDENCSFVDPDRTTARGGGRFHADTFGNTTFPERSKPVRIPGVGGAPRRCIYREEFPESEHWECEAKCNARNASLLVLAPGDVDRLVAEGGFGFEQRIAGIT